MKIERLSITRYGRFRDWDSGPAELPGIVVVLGPNESGKSTLFDGLCSVFFGFAPATRDNHPYAPWDGSNPELSARLRLDDGAVLEVTRKLMSSPRGEITVSGDQVAIGNRPLEPVEWIPRKLHRGVYALRLDELGALAGDEWNRVKDRLMGGNAATDLESPRVAARTAADEAHRHWRPDRRGKSEAKRLQEHLDTLLGLRATAQEGERRLRDHAVERDRLAVQLGALKEEQTSLEAELEQAAELNSLHVRIQRLRELEEAAGNLDELEGLSDSPVSERERLAEKEAEAIREAEFVAAERAEAEALVALDLGDRDPALRNAERIRNALGHRERIGRDRAEVARLEAKILESERSLSDRAPEFFDGDWRALDSLELARTPVEEVRGAIRSVLEAESRVARAEAELRPPEPPASTGLLGGSPVRIALAVLSLVLGVALLLLPQPWAGGAGGVFLLVGVALFLQPWLARLEADSRPRAPVRPDPARALEESHSALVAAQSDFRDLVGGLPLRDKQLVSPDPELAAELRRIRNELADRRTRTERREALLADLGRIEDDVRAIASECGLDDAPVERLLDRLDRALEDARAREKDAASARQRLVAIERKEARYASQLSEVRAEIVALEERAGGAEEPGDALRVLARRIESARQAVQRREELDREGIDPDEVEGRVARARQEGSEFIDDPDAVARGRVRWRQLTLEVNEAAERLGVLTRTVDGPRDTRTLADVDGEIDATREAIRRAEEEHDRLLVLAALIREADRRFREAHQPDVIRRAEAHLARITGGRYERLFAEDDGGDERFYVRGDGAPEPVDVGTGLSTGTREQVYLALRLAAIDHLDDGADPLPLFFDETFSNWDADRVERGLEVLTQVAERRQVIVLTCHEGFAEQVASIGGQIIRLEAPS